MTHTSSSFPSSSSYASASPYDSPYYSWTLTPERPASERRFWCNFLGQQKEGMPDRAALLEGNNLPTRPLSKASHRWRAGWADLSETGDPIAFRCGVR